MIDIKQEYFFPPMFRIFGGVLCLLGPLVLITQPHTLGYYVLTVVFLLTGLTMVFLRYGLSIDVANTNYRIYRKLFWQQFGNKTPFRFIEKFFINEVRDTIVMTTRAGITHNITKSAFKAYMKLDDGSKVHVDTDQDKEKLKERVENYIALSHTILKSKTLEW